MEEQRSRISGESDPLSEVCPDSDEDCIKKVRRHCPDLDEACVRGLTQMDYYLVGRENFPEKETEE